MHKSGSDCLNQPALGPDITYEFGQLNGLLCKEKTGNVTVCTGFYVSIWGFYRLKHFGLALTHFHRRSLRGRSRAGARANDSQLGLDWVFLRWGEQYRLMDWAIRFGAEAEFEKSYIRASAIKIKEYKNTKIKKNN